jgi:RNA polymerase sigma-70 factor (ECF subfamily)
MMRANTTAYTTTRPLEKQDLVRIYEQYSPSLYRYAVRLIGDQVTAEDCVAETFSRLLHALRSGGGPTENIQAYLYRMAHNWIVDYYRRREERTGSLEIEEHADPLSNPMHLITQQQDREQIRMALLRLTHEQQQVIYLRFLEDLSHEEVAMAIGKSVEATRALQHRALATLRRMLDDQEKANTHD